MRTSIEEARKKIQSIAAHKRQAAGQIKKIKPVVMQFDGKIYNKRFDEAISALSDDENIFYCSNSYGWFYLHHRAKESGYNEGNDLLTGYSCKATENERRYSTEDINKLFEDNKRIKADKMIERLNSKYASLLKEAADLEEAADNLDTFYKQFDNTLHLLNTLVHQVPYTVINVCGIKSNYYA